MEVSKLVECQRGKGSGLRGHCRWMGLGEGWHIKGSAQGGRQKNDPPESASILIPVACEYVRSHGKGELRLQKELPCYALILAKRGSL